MLRITIRHTIKQPKMPNFQTHSLPSAGDLAFNKFINS